jgi:hypothetical protein
MNPTRSPASSARTDTRKSDRSVFTLKTSGYPSERCLRPGARGTREQFLKKFTIGPIGAPVHGRIGMKIGPGEQSRLGLTQTPEVCPRDKTPSGPFRAPTIPRIRKEAEIRGPSVARLPERRLPLKNLLEEKFRMFSQEFFQGDPAREGYSQEQRGGSFVRMMDQGEITPDPFLPGDIGPFIWHRRMQPHLQKLPEMRHDKIPHSLAGVMAQSLFLAGEFNWEAFGQLRCAKKNGHRPKHLGRGRQTRYGLLFVARVRMASTSSSCTWGKFE